MTVPSMDTGLPGQVLVVETAERSSELQDYLRDQLDVPVLAACSFPDAVEAAAACSGLKVAVIRGNPEDVECRELVENLRGLHPDVGVVLVSRNGDPAAVQSIIASQVDEFVIEPIDPDYVREVVNEMLSGHDLHCSPIP